MRCLGFQMIEGRRVFDIGVFGITQPAKVVLQSGPVDDRLDRQAVRSGRRTIKDTDSPAANELPPDSPTGSKNKGSASLPTPIQA